MTLYLKYRPTSFETLVGQDFIKNTLRQAVLQEKLVGAYLFCWPRGTGKTSTARIFAKAMNCLHAQEGNPCLECEICVWFQNENLVDIIEIDAASYTWVDNIREIIEKATFSPTKCKYKVYIIDEVHMLSKGAFNALLKILEEPPAHLKFILATTESHKIPETILSRCQRYDFKSITNEDIKNRLLFIAQEEDIKIDEQSIEFITKQANGWLRNAISLFEQLNYNGEISFETVIHNYGIPKNEVVESFYIKLIQKDESILSDFEEISWNYNLSLFFKEVLFFLKEKLVEHIGDIQNVTSHIFLLETLEDAYRKSKNSFDSKTSFLLWIVKCIKNISSSQISQEFQAVPEKKNKDSFIKKEIDIPFLDEKQTQEISSGDLFDIFWENDSSNISEAQNFPVQKENISPQKEVKNNIGTLSNFDVEAFISTLKTIGAKWALTMSMRASSIQFDEKNLVVFTKTKIALKQISSSDNIALITQALENMWFLDINIEIK